MGGSLCNIYICVYWSPPQLDPLVWKVPPFPYTWERFFDDVYVCFARRLMPRSYSNPHHTWMHPWIVGE